MLALTEADDGSTHAVAVGDTVEVRLRETATTGYRWTARLEGGALEELPEDEPDAASEPRGAGGERLFRFRAVAAGPADLRLVLQRSWEREPIQEFGVHLTIQAP